MQKIVVYLFVIFLIFSLNNPTAKPELPTSTTTNTAVSECEKLYTDIGLGDIVNYEAFQQALEGYQKLDLKNKDIMTLIDFSKPSTEERLYVIDMKHKKLLFSSHVAHGRNSGANYATTFSNKNGSFKSSLGFYSTDNTYIGKNGYSLILDGLEKGINDNARQRAIVIHGADYANPGVIASSGRLGRSLGCPALPQAISKIIINTIKGGTLLYIYAGNQNYLAQSSVLSNRIATL